MRVLPMLALCMITACAPYEGAQVSKSFVSDRSEGISLPVMQGFGTSPNPAPIRSTADLMHLFDLLEFNMESGRSLPILTRFEGPITVRMIGKIPPTASADLTRLITRFRTEAGIDIRTVSADQDASITIDFQSRADMSRVVPSAACFVVPRVKSFEEYKQRRNTADVDWTTVVQRKNVAVFVPADTAPQEVRDCLNEELAQAMGPLNDLYQNPDSVFNDDNFNSVLTSFDMLMLRVHYAPELRSGMNRVEVAKHLPTILARLNPNGVGLPATRPTQMSPRSWVAAVEGSFGINGNSQSRLEAADRMVSIAMAQGWRDARLGFSYYAKGRALSVMNRAKSIEAFAEAARIYRATPGAQVQAAHVDMQLAAIALASGQAGKAMQFADRAIPVVKSAENAALMATLMMIKAEALENLGQSAAGKAQRLDSLGWARYGFGAESAMRARQAEIASIGARGRRG
jgi:hypothetical protein